MGCSGGQSLQKKEDEQRPHKTHQQRGLSKQPSDSKLKITGPDMFVTLRTGSITNEYQMMEILGDGGASQVRLVKHQTTGIFQAMKVIDQEQVKEAQQDMDRLFTEANILKSLDHANIVRIYELFQDETSFYMITEYCGGGELYQRITQTDSFNEAQASGYIQQVLSAIAHCHDMKIVHRDLKPENLLFQSTQIDSNLQVIDFGIAFKYDPEEKVNQRVGTPYYMAPEVCLKKNYDEKCDVWSCGVIVYILLCGTPPFQGNCPQEIMQNIIETEVEMDEEEWEGISNEAQDFIRKLLNQDFKTRISAYDALQEPWIQRNVHTKPLSNNIMKNLKGFYSSNQMRAAIMMFIATNVVSQKDKQELLNTFKALDKDGDGTLTKVQMIDGYKTINKDMDPQEIVKLVDSIFEEIDTNNSGKVDFSGKWIRLDNSLKLFILHLNCQNSSQPQCLNRHCFLDKGLNRLSNYSIRYAQLKNEENQDGDGHISREEMQHIMGGQDIDEEAWNQILNECDADGDGQISLEEFIVLLSQKVEQKQ